MFAALVTTLVVAGVLVTTVEPTAAAQPEASDAVAKAAAAASAAIEALAAGQTVDVAASSADAPTAAPAAATDGTASFTWSMPERFGPDANNDHLIDMIDSPSEAPLANPTTWTVNFNACEANGQPRPGATYSWTFGTNAPTAPTTACTTSRQYAAVDTAYDVTLTVVDTVGTATKSERIVPRDYVVVIMGDSASSGEGNPDWLEADWSAGVKNALYTPKWNNEQCHRSALSGQAQAALRLEQRDPHSSVTFVHVGCSGARITRGILAPYQGIVNKAHPRLDCDDPNLANPSKPGQTFYIKYPDPALDAPNPQGQGCLPSQIDQVKSILGTRSIDAISVVAGINDLFFSKPIMACLIEDDCTTAHSTMLRDAQNRLQTAAEFEAPRIAQLPDRYDALFSALMSNFTFRAANPQLGISEGHVFLAEYPNSGQYPDGSPCDSNELGIVNKAPDWVKTSVAYLLQSLATSADAGHFSSTEWAWATQNILTPLNTAGQNAVAAANAKWPGRVSIVTGSTHAFDAHGYCSPDSWMQSVGTSFLYQRDPEGSFHPNRAGHFYGYALPLESALATQLGVTAPALPPTVGGDIETLEAISQTWAPLMEVLGRTNIIEQLDKIHPVKPGASSKKGRDWSAIMDKVFSGIAEHVGNTVAAHGLSEADVWMDDIDGINGPDNDGQIGDIVIDVSGEISPHTLADKYALDIHITAHGPAASLDWSMAGLSLQGEGSELLLDTTLRFVIEPGRTDGFRAYLPVADNSGFTVRMKAEQELPASANTTAQLGPVDVIAHGPQGGKAVDIDTGLTVKLVDPDGDGKVTIDEISGASFSSLFEITCATGSHVDLDIALDGGLPGLTTNIARMQLHDTNVCDGVSAPTFTFAEPDLAGLSNMGTNEVLDLANALANVLERLQAAGNLPVPFTAQQMRDALNLVQQIRDIAADPANAVKTSLQTLVAKLEAALGLAPGAMNLRFDMPTKRFLFDLTFNPSVSNASLPVDLGVLAGAGIIGADAAANVTVSANAAIVLHFAFDVTPDPAGTTTENLRSVSDRLLISTSSTATFDAGASVLATATANVGLLPVEVSLDNGSGAEQQLIAKPDPSKPLASVTITGPGAWVSLADLLSGDPAKASVNVGFNAGLAPTTVRARAVLGGTELAHGNVTVSWADLSAFSGANGPQVTADADFGASVARFIAAANDPIELLNLVLGGLRDAANAAVDLARTNEQLARSLPLIGKGYDDVVAGFAKIGAAADSIAKLHQNLTLPQIEAALEAALADALGVAPAAVADKISLTLDRSQPRTALVLSIDLCQASAASSACSAVRPVQGTFSLDANGFGVVGTAGQATVSLDYLARLKIDLALELPSVNLPDATHPTAYIADGEAPAGVYVLGSTGVDVRLGATANGVIKGIVGPFAASLGMIGTLAGQPYNDPATVNAKVAFRVASGGANGERLTPGAWLAKVQQNIAQNGVTQPVTTTCPANNAFEGCAVLPVYFQTAAGDITAADGTIWKKLGTAPITFDAPHLLDPSSYAANVPQSVLDDLQANAFSFSSLITAIRYILDQAKVSLDGAKIGQQLPIVGDAYAAGSTLVAQIDAVAAKLQTLAAEIDKQNSAGNVKTTISSWLFTNLGPSSSLKLILDRNGDGQITVADVDVVVMCGAAACANSAPLQDITDVKLVMSIGKVAEATQPPIDFGVKGLQIKSEGTASASIGWHLDLAVGIDDGGVYVDPAGVGNRPELGLSLDASLPQLFDATILGLPIKITDTHAGKDVDIDLGVDVLGAADQHLRLPELLGRGDNPNDRGAVAFTVKGCADLNVGFEVAVPGLTTPDALPSVQGDIAFHTDWNGCPGTAGAGRDLRDGFSPNAKFSMKNLRVDAGKLASQYIGKVAKEIQRITGPLQPVINTIQQPVPIVSDLAQLVGKDQITWLEAWAAGQRASGNDVTAVETIIKLIDFVNTFKAGDAPQIGIPLADDFDIDLTQAQFAFADPDEAFDKLIAGTPVVKDVLNELAGAGWDIKSSIAAVADEAKGAKFSFPALEKPSLLLQMLFGKDVDIALFDAGTLRAENGFDYYYGLPFAKVGIRGNAKIEGHFAVSYDTAGIRRTVASKPLKWSSLGALVHGFGINDLDSNGDDVPEIRLDASLALYAYAGIPGANVTAEGGVEGYLQADLIDPDGDGKVRYDEIAKRIGNPRCLFDTTGAINAFARVKGKLGPFTGTKDIVKPYTLWEFSSIESWCRQIENGGGAGGTPVPPPVLAEVNSDGHTLDLNVGDRASRRNLGGGDDEIVTITDLGDGRVNVSMFGVTQTYGSTTKPIDAIRALPGAGNDQINLFGPSGPGTGNVLFNIQAGAGNDIIRAGNGKDQILGDAGDDVIDGRGNDDIIVGGDGNDTIDAGAGDDTVNGDTSGNAGFGNDTIDGGDGIDKLRPMNGLDTVIGGAGDDIIDGGATFIGSTVASGPDRLDGGEGKDTIVGSKDGDVIIGGINAAAGIGQQDGIIGGDGDDCIVADTGTATIEVVDGVSVCTVVLDDVTIAEQDNVIAGKGADTVFGGPGNDSLDGDDQSNGDVSDDRIFGGVGDDTILGAGGNDALIGEAGDDKLSGEEGADHLEGGDGIDTMDGGNGDDELLGGAGGDTANGNAGNDMVSGDEGNDKVDGFLSSANSPITVDGNDVVDGGPGNDTAWGGPGDDRVSGAAGDDTLTSESGNDTVVGGAGNDGIDAGAGNDVLRGGDGDDRLTGRAGDDRLEGGDGNDVLGGDAVRFTVLNPATFPSGAYRIQPRFDLNIGGNDTYDGGTGDDFVYDVVLDPVSEASRQNLTVTVTDTADHGSTGGTVVDYLYTAATGYKGDDLIGFQLKLNGVVTNTGTIVIGNGQNTAPVAADDEAATDRLLPVQGNVLLNDTDPNGDVLEAVPASGTTGKGTWSVVAGGGFTYTPKATATGSDTFTYTAKDPDGATDTATVTISIRPEYVPPVVSCEHPGGWSGTERTVTCTATDAGSGLADPTQASFQLTTALGAGKEGPAQIDPPAVCDTAGNCTDLDPFEVLVDRKAPTVTSANAGQTYTQGSAVTLQVECADAGSGVALGCGGNGQALDTSTLGVHQVHVAAADAVSNITEIVVSYTVVSGNAAPTATADAVTVDYGTTATGNALANDTDPDGDALAVTPAAIDDPSGRFVIQANGAFTFTPAALFSGTKQFPYTVTDARGASASSTVTITVRADTLAPSVSCPAPTGWSASEVTVTCTATDSGTGIGTGGTRPFTFTLTTALGSGKEGPTSLDPQSVCDNAGNCTDLPPFTVLVDRKVPTVSSADNGATYRSDLLGKTKQVTCADGGSGLAQPSCPPNGEALDLTPGAHSYTVTAADKVGNTTTLVVRYTVTAVSTQSLAVDDVTVRETDKTITVNVPVRLAKPSSTKVTVNYTTVIGTAGSKDAGIPGKGKVVFDVDKRLKVTPTVVYIPITIAGDNLREANETFTVTISSTDVPVSDGTATVTIVDDDGLGVR